MVVVAALVMAATADPVVAEMGKARTHEAVRLKSSHTGIDSCSSTGCH